MSRLTLRLLQTSSAALELEETDYTVGPLRTFNAKAERFTGKRGKANEFLSRASRDPYIVLETVQPCLGR